MTTQDPSSATPDIPRPTPGALFLLWLSVGLQSFGGGTATLATIRREFVDRRKWVTDDEFVRDWAICQVAPGINLIALTTLIGKRLAGYGGIPVSLAGLLLPSAFVTALITAAYVHVQGLTVLQAALRGVIPATVGLGLVTAWQMARPLLHASRHGGRWALLTAVAVLVGGGVAVGAGHWSPVAALACAGLAGALVFRRPEGPVPEEGREGALPGGRS